jgi:hypothetical protein
MGKNIPNIIDAMVKIRISLQGYTTRRFPESTDYVTEHHYTYIIHWNNKPYGPSYPTTETINNPTMTVKTTPAYDVQVGHAGVEFELFRIIITSWFGA